jgi:lysozyme family protein
MTLPASAIVRAVDALLVREGWPAFTNDPADRGGPTKGGITLQDLSEQRGCVCTIADLQAMEEPEAREIYSHKYIVVPKFHTLPDEWVFNFIADTAVLQGESMACHVLQGTLNVPMDGDIGPVTLASLALALQDPARLRKALIRERMHHLLDAMVVGVPVELRQSSNLKWRHGWWNRTCDFI